MRINLSLLVIIITKKKKLLTIFAVDHRHQLCHNMISAHYSFCVLIVAQRRMTQRGFHLYSAQPPDNHDPVQNDFRDLWQTCTVPWNSANNNACLCVFVTDRTREQNCFE